MQNINTLIKGVLPHLIPFLVFFAVVSVYFFPLYEGKSLVQSDNIQLQGTMSEYKEYSLSGEDIGWSNAQFSGMPLQTGSPTNFFRWCKSIFSWLPQPIVMMIWLYLGFYVLMIVMKVKPWVAGIASMAYAFSSFNIVSIEVGHDNKVYAMAFMAPVLAGAILAYRRQLLVSLVVTSIFLGFHIYFGHIQISYYLLIMLLGYAIKEFIYAIRAKEIPDFIKGSAILLLAAFLAVGGNIVKLWKIYEYSGVSNRGGSELVTEATVGSPSQSGLDLDYALNWSSGGMELFTIMIPYFHGGASGESLDSKSSMGEAMQRNGVPNQQIGAILTNVPTYWGDQPFTQGPIYFGIIVVFLFLISLFILPKSLVAWGMTLVILSFLLAMGKNALWFSELFFYNVPLYNKFRSVTMIVAIPQLIFPFFGFVALNQLLEKTTISPIHKKVVLRALGICGSLLVLFFLFKNVFFDFQGLNDGAYRFPDWLLVALREDRIALFNGDIFRGFLFLSFVVALGWFWSTNRLTTSRFVLVFGVIILLDLVLVDRRYLGGDDFQMTRSSNLQMLQPSSADLSIQQDPEYYRVFNTTRGVTSDGITSNHHFSISGYSAIKIQRYQEVIDRYISQGSIPVLSMLNAKYFIVAGQNNDVQARVNSNALGSAWLVESVQMVENANEEIDALGNVDLRTRVIVDERFGSYLDGETSFGNQGNVRLEDYHPERMTYSVNTTESGFIVFSEIFYQTGWQAYLDNEPVDHIRVNYILRGLKTPAGEHEIRFEYEPGSARYGKVVSGVSQVFVLGILIFFLFQNFRRNNQPEISED